MHRFYCNPEQIGIEQIVMTNKTQLHHMVDVLRLKPGDAVVIVDGKGKAYDTHIESIDKYQAKLKIVSSDHKKQVKSGLRLTVACALPKKAKINFIVEKLTELGVERIILLLTERTQVRLKDQKAKIEKLSKTATEALKQSNGLVLPKIDIMSFNDLIKLARNFELSLLPHLGAGTRVIRGVLEGSKAKKVLAAIGPEGDFSPEEINAAIKSGFIPVSLGPTVLKVDTAAICVASFIRFFKSAE